MHFQNLMQRKNISLLMSFLEYVINNVRIYHECEGAGFIQASIIKIQGLFKDLSNIFQGRKVNEKYCSECSNSTSEMLD